MANYQESLNGAYRMMASQPMQTKANSTGGIDADVKGMDGYGDSNYGWTKAGQSYSPGVADRVNSGSASYLAGTVGQGKVDSKPAAAPYEGKSNQDSWWAKAYADVGNWAIKEEQVNPDRQAYQDSFKMSMAEKGLNYELSKGMSTHLNEQERGLMTLSSDLGRRNTIDIMGAEHGFKTAGMETSQRLAKDYLGAETDSDVRKTQETGYQGRLGMAEQGYQEREGMAEQGYQTRANTRTTGQENRLQVRTTGDEERRTSEHKNRQEVDTITRMGRR